MKLSPERPMRIKLDMNAMKSKLVNEVPISLPPEAIKKKVKVIEGEPILSTPVLSTMKQWRFAPTLLDGDPVEVKVQVTYTFERSRYLSTP